MVKFRPGMRAGHEKQRFSMLFSVAKNNKNCLFPSGDLYPIYYMVYWAYPIRPSKRHLDRFSRFRQAHKRVQHTDRHTDHATPSVSIGRYRFDAA